MNPCECKYFIPKIIPSDMIYFFEFVKFFGAFPQVSLSKKILNDSLIIYSVKIAGKNLGSYENNENCINCKIAPIFASISSPFFNFAI